jgi:hypothetical protein
MLKWEIALVGSSVLPLLALLRNQIHIANHGVVQWFCIAIFAILQSESIQYEM